VQSQFSVVRKVVELGKLGQRRRRQPMLLSDDLRAWCIDFLSSRTFQQVAPLLVVLLVPSLFILVATKAELSSLVYAITMGLESFGFSLPWSWPLSNGASTASDKRASSRAGKKSRKHPRTRAEQVAGNGSVRYGASNFGCEPPI
jgi:ubiquitin carboxyl-terminal hydrolase 1